MSGGMGRAVVFGLILTAIAVAQGPRRTFEVASVKRLDQDWLETSPQRSAGRITWTTDLPYLIGYAYRLQPARISLHIPGGSEIYRVEALTAGDATDDAIREMLQSLLADRFHMRSHRESKEVEGYALSAARGGIRNRNDEAAATFPEGRVAAISEAAGLIKLAGRNVTAGQLAARLERLLDAPVVDRTGVDRTMSFVFRYADEASPALTEAPYLVQALQKELGLTLEKRRVPVETLVVDSIERTPTEN
jgi:uncharacterized protein (TIGR03435 family)